VRVELQEGFDLTVSEIGLERWFHGRRDPGKGNQQRTEPNVATRRISFSYSTLAPGGRWTYDKDHLRKLAPHSTVGLPSDVLVFQRMSARSVRGGRLVVLANRQGQAGRACQGGSSSCAGDVGGHDAGCRVFANGVGCIDRYCVWPGRSKLVGEVKA
jgi:hypothetical protein